MANDFKVVRNTLSQIASRVLVVAVSLLTTAILTRTLGIEKFGDYVFITSIALLFVGLTDFGTTTIAVRETSCGQTNKKDEVFKNVLGLRLIISLPIFVIFNLLVLLLPQFNGIREISLLGSLVIPFLVLRTTAQAVLQTFLRLDLASVLEVVASALLIMFLGILLFVNKTVSLSWLMVFWSVSALLSGTLGIYWWKRYLRFGLGFNKEICLSIFKKSLPLGIYLLVYAVYDRGIDSFFLKTYSGSRAVGLYGLAYKIHGNLIFLAAFLMNSLLPIISSLKEKGEVLKRIFKRAFSFLFFCGMVVLIVGILISPFVINLLAGKNFIASSGILRILLFATLFSFLNHLTGYLMICLDQQKKLLSFSVIAFLVNILLNFIFIPIYSFKAAAVTTVLTEATIFFLTKNYLSKKYDLKMSLNDLRENFVLLFKEKLNYFEKL